MATTVIDDPDLSRFEITVGGVPAGVLQYHLFGATAAFLHTEVRPEFGGRGLATSLITAALDEARTRGWTVEPFCPFVRGVIGKHPEYRELVAESQWARFGLA